MREPTIPPGHRAVDEVLRAVRDDHQRLDRWLWHARVVKTRDLACRLIEAGRVRVDRRRESKPGAGIRRGQVLTITLADRTRVLRVLDFVERRGSAAVAAGLYEDLTAARPGDEPSDGSPPGP